MSQLSFFTAEERALLVSIPYRAGVFMSHADDVGGEEDDQREHKALEATMRALASKEGYHDVVREILQTSLNNAAQWSNWQETAPLTLRDGKAAIAILQDKTTDEVAKSYRKAVLHIAQSVAMAYGEFSGDDWDEPEEEGFWGSLMNGILGRVQKVEEESGAMNISASEDSALSALANALAVE